MAKNNTLMTIVLVLAAAFLFSGGLTGNAGRDFAYTSPQTTRNIGEICDTSRTFGEYLPGGQPAIISYNSDCTTYVKEYCKQTARPFERRNLGVSGAAAQRFELVCVDRVIDSTSPPTVYGG